MFQTVLLKSANTEAAKPPGVDTLKRYRKSRHPVQNEMKKELSELKNAEKPIISAVYAFFYLLLRKKRMKLFYCIEKWEL